VEVVFLAHFELLVAIELHLNTTANLSIVADHVHLFITTVYQFSDGGFQLDNTMSQKLKSST